MTTLTFTDPAPGGPDANEEGIVIPAAYTAIKNWSTHIDKNNLDNASGIVTMAAGLVHADVAFGAASWVGNGISTQQVAIGHGLGRTPFWFDVFPGLVTISGSSLPWVGGFGTYAAPNNSNAFIEFYNPANFSGTGTYHAGWIAFF